MTQQDWLMLIGAVVWGVERLLSYRKKADLLDVIEELRKRK